MTFVVEGTYDEGLFKADYGEEDVEYSPGNPIRNVEGWWWCRR